MHEVDRGKKRYRRVFLVLGVFFLLLSGGWGIYWMATARNHDLTPVTATKGEYRGSVFTLTSLDGHKEKVAYFSPALKKDEAVVIGALWEIMHMMYGEPIEEGSVSPVVEVLDEKNYVTFSMGNSKTYFQLFKNSKEEVGSIEFWRDGARY